MTKGTSAYVVGIYSSNNDASSLISSATGITITSTGGRNEFVTLTGNTIQDVHIGIALRGFNHTVAPNDFQDYNFVIGASGQGNTIQNYAGGNTGTTYGIYLINHTNPMVSYNTINNAAGGGVNATGQIYGIFMSATSASVNRGGDVVMNNNNITLGISVTTASGVNSITIAPISTSVTVNNNTFGFGTFATIGNTTLISIAQNTPSITVTGNQSSGTITKTGASGNFTGYSNSGNPVNGSQTIANNNFSNIVLSGTSAFTGISNSASTTTTVQFYNNTVSNITSGSGTTYGMIAGTALTQQVYNNIVSNLASTGTTLIGLQLNSGNSGTANCYKNQIYNVSSTNTATSTQLSGIQLNSGLQINVYNNFISDLKVPNTTSTANALFGINASSSNATNKFYMYFNTIFLNSTGASAYRSFGIFSNTGNTSELRNNIVVNTSTGIPVAYGRSTNAFGTYSSLSDNNDFFATNIFFEGTGSTLYTTLDSYKTLVYPRDQATFSENAPFVNAATAPYDLHINSSIASQIESGGRPVTAPISITEDFDGITRNANFPDVGADEFSGIALDLTAPIIVYTPLLNTGSLTNRTLVANVSDPSGVPTAAPGWPNLYWKKNAGGTYTAVQPTSFSGSDYTFNFGAGVTPGDTVFYYVVAQDGATTPNLRAFPTIGAGGYTANPPAASIPPTTPYSYLVSNTALTGDYTVGSALFTKVTGRTITFQKSGDNWIPMENGQPYSGDLFAKKVDYPEYNYPDGIDGVYLTLTAAVADLNLRGVAGPVNFLLTDASYSTGETFPYVIDITNESKPTSVNTVTFKPNTGVTSLIQGAASNSALFKILNSYVGIDGSNAGGIDRSLTIENTSTTFSIVVQFSSIGTIPITGGSLKNSIVINGSNLATAYTPAVLVSSVNIDPSISSYTSGYFTNISIDNNSIQKSYYGILVNGIAAAGNGNGLSINGNDLNSSTNPIGWFGIQITGVDGATITNNNVANILSGNTPGPVGIFVGSQTINSTISNNTIGPLDITSGSAPTGLQINTGNANSNLIVSNNTITGIRFNQAAVCVGLQVGGLTGNVLITRNKIYDIKNTQVSTTAYGAYAVQLFSSLAAANITFSNNFIWDVAAYGRASTDFHNGYGIQIPGGGGYNIYHNTISLTTEQTLAEGLPACIMITSSVTTPASLDIRNNIFATFQTVGTDRYAIICKAPATVFAYIDNNDYYTTGSNLGYFGAANVADLAAWRIATGKDVNSISGNPQFVSANDLHIDSTATIVSNNGFYLATVPQDIDGQTRNNPPDIGADEYTVFVPVVDPSAVTALAISDVQIDVAFTANTNNDNVVIVFNTWGTFETPTGTPPAIGDWFAGGTLLANSTTSPFSHTGLNPNATYYYKLFSYNGTNYSSGVSVNATTLVPPPGESYAYNSGPGSYGTINLTTGMFTSWNFRPQGNFKYPVTADNDTLNSQYTIMSDFGSPASYTLWKINFTTLSGDSIAPVGPLASGQSLIQGMAYNKITNTWYVISRNDAGSAAYLYTLNLTTGALAVVGQIQNANIPVALAVDCNGNAYIVNVIPGATNTAVLNSLNLTTAVATAIGTDLGLK